jgi:hypothetical protein
VNEGKCHVHLSIDCFMWDLYIIAEYRILEYFIYYTTSISKMSPNQKLWLRVVTGTGNRPVRSDPVEDFLPARYTGR